MYKDRRPCRAPRPRAYNKPFSTIARQLAPRQSVPPSFGMLGAGVRLRLRRSSAASCALFGDIVAAVVVVVLRFRRLLGLDLFLCRDFSPRFPEILRLLLAAPFSIIFRAKGNSAMAHVIRTKGQQMKTSRNSRNGLILHVLPLTLLIHPLVADVQGVAEGRREHEGRSVPRALLPEAIVERLEVVLVDECLSLRLTHQEILII